MTTARRQKSGELKTRVNACLDKLSDRDTLSTATCELENIARTLSSDNIATFLSCISVTDLSDKSPVRRQCVRLLGILSTAHGDTLSPHLSRMIYAVVRRLRDPESAVRSACVDAVGCMTAHVALQPFTAVFTPLVDALFREKDANAQMASSLCLSAAVGAAPEVDTAALTKLLPRILKLVKSESFKPKPALLLFIGSIVSCGCARSRSSISPLISTVIEFLSNEDWSARKAAAEVLAKMAAADSEFATEFQSSCVAALERRKFDKVMIVRETMNRALDTWRNLPISPKDLLSTPKALGTYTPSMKNIPSCSPVATCQFPSTGRRRSLKLEENLNLSDEISQKWLVNGKEFPEMTLIIKQLLQIQTQQSCVLNVLQEFTRSWYKKMHSLEKRVSKLEKTVEVGVASRDLGARKEGILGHDPVDNECCPRGKAEIVDNKIQLSCS